MSAVRIRAALGQNFLRHASTARLILRQTRLEAHDRVYDLGAGTGILTAEIVKHAAHVVAVERDANLARKLRARFAGARVSVVEGELAEVRFVAPYKVVANIPFNRTAVVMHRLLFETPRCESALLLVQREAAEKYAGVARLSAVCLMLKPWFAAEIVHRFAPHDFVPAPGVDTVLLRIERRTAPLLGEDERPGWEAFVRYALGRCRSDARGTFRPLLSNLQWRRLSCDLGIAEDARLDVLSVPQWLGIYRFVRDHAAAHKRQRIGQGRLSTGFER